METPSITLIQNKKSDFAFYRQHDGIPAIHGLQLLWAWRKALHNPAWVLYFLQKKHGEEHAGYGFLPTSAGSIRAVFVEGRVADEKYRYIVTSDWGLLSGQNTWETAFAVIKVTKKGERYIFNGGKVDYYEWIISEVKKAAKRHGITPTEWVVKWTDEDFAHLLMG
jgi:hypothetical protein